MNNSRYSQRGVSADKEDVHQAIKNLDKGLYPNAFCKILPDVAAGDMDYCNIMHADTAGTKTALAYLYYKETGDLEVWKGIAQDAIVMNLDDMACAGATNNYILSSTIGRNKNLIPGEVISAVIKGTVEFADTMENYGINIHLAGGETADVGDIVRTIDVGYTAFTRYKKKDVIEVNIQDDDVIVGLASFGKASYENNYNSGIGCNGLTSARHDVLSKYLMQQYPESFDASIPDELIYSGSRKIDETYNDSDIGKMLLSPTRTFLPVIREVVNKVNDRIHGIIHCTGGAQTKVMKFARNMHIIKNNLFDTPSVFKLIQQESGTDWKEMYKVFNMGNRLEFYVKREDAQKIIDIANKFNIEAQIIGECQYAEQNKLTIESEHGTFEY